MAKANEDGSAKESELPRTLQESDDKAQRTYAQTLDSAEEQYGDGQRAHQTAWAAVKHSHEKVGDHWEPKEENGPSDQKAEEGRDSDAPTAGGVDANASKDHLYEVAQRLDVPGRSDMTKDELVEAIQLANDRESAKNR